MEGDDQQDPLVDAARALLDGHIMLDRRLALRSHYPPIAILDSISRLMPEVCPAGALARLKRCGGCWQLLRLGRSDPHRGLPKGSDSALDKALGP